MSSIEENNNGKIYWRALSEGELAGDETRETGAAPGTMERRRFLQIMGASVALAGLSGCRFPVEKIVPFSSQPQGMTPGEAVEYATSMDFAGTASALLATSFDGRPIKIDGNPLGGRTGGSSNVFQQAGILELYDPDRSRFVSKKQNGRERASSWDDFAAFASPHFARLRANGGKGLRVLSEATSSPGVEDMRARFMAAYPKARWHEYEPVSRDNELAGAKLISGKPFRTHLRLDKAAVIVCLDEDILMTHPESLQYARDFADGRTAADGKMNRLYAVESNYTVTGAIADHRMSIPAGEVKRFLLALASDLFINKKLPMPAAFKGNAGLLKKFVSNAFPAEFVSALGSDLMAHRGESVIVCGPRQPAEVHALAHLINDALGNTGKTVWRSDEPCLARHKSSTDATGLTASSTFGECMELHSHADSIKALAADMRGGKVGTLLILGGNPAWNAPADLDFEKALRAAGTSIHLSLYKDETSNSCGWRLPMAHFLEAWGAGRSFDGSVSVAQPLIEPLYGGKSAIEVLSLIVDKQPLGGQQIVRRAIHADGVDSGWRKILHDGILPGGGRREIKPAFAAGNWLGELLSKTEALRKRDGIEIVFTPDYSVYDGRFANNGWLQELPDPITKITWDNAALMSPATAKSHGVARGDVIRIIYKERKIEIPAYILPGHADGSITLPLGYGRRKSGRVGNGAGTDVYPLRTSGAMDIAAGARIEKTGRTYLLATTQEHHDIKEIGRKATEERVPNLIREATLDEYKKRPDFAKSREHHPPLKSLWQETKYNGYKWGMSIDLTRCIGCSACAIACQAENNVPIVGKEQVSRGREMHWIRVDRYFSGEENDPNMVFQPVPCMQCENAPCEQVCPVAATLHTAEGLNDMVYNRCIGMRYCSQNCPYKVRRFNFFNNNKNITDVEKMVFNPDVTVRMRGVMEKCTYCVQRIQKAKIGAAAGGREIRDGEVIPACAQACPTRAIKFGNLNDPASDIKKSHAHGRAYALLEELNIKPRTLYLAKLRNPKSKA